MFAFLVSLNIIMMLFIIRWRGTASCEGIASVIVLIYLSSYALPMLAYTGNGLISLAVGLASYSALKHDVMHIPDVMKPSIIKYAYLLMAIGLLMKMAAIYLSGIGGLYGYFNELYEYDIKVRKFGFLDQGLNIAEFGCALLIVLLENNVRAQAFWSLVGILLALTLSISKSGSFLFFLPLYVLAKYFSEKTLRYWVRVRFVIPMFLLFFVALGIKTQVKYFGLNDVEFSMEAIAGFSTEVIETRASGNGLFSGFVNLVNRTYDDEQLTLHGNLLKTMFTGLIPRFLYETAGAEKPEHPFKAMGAVLRNDYTIDENSNDAPTLVGAEFADFGVASMVAYLLVSGMLLSLLRKYSEQHRNIAVPIAHAFFVSSFGMAFGESGIASIFYYLIISIGVFLVYFLLQGHQPMLDTFRGRR